MLSESNYALVFIKIRINISRGKIPIIVIAFTFVLYVLDLILCSRSYDSRLNGLSQTSREEKARMVYGAPKSREEDHSEAS